VKYIRRLPTTIFSATPGVVCAGIVGLFSIALAKQTGIPVMLLAVIFGLLANVAVNQMKSANGASARVAGFDKGVHWSATNLLYIGVALLGLRIDFSDLSQVGLVAPLVVLSALVITVGGGFMIARSFGQPSNVAWLTGGAVAICGASAAAAIVTVLPRNDDKVVPQRYSELVLIIAGVTAISTLAMMVYPLIAVRIGFGDLAAGVFLGGSIHNVSQAVGAGYSVSSEAGDVAVLLKLLRVACLLPAMIVISILSHRAQANASESQRIGAHFPPFLVVFAVLAALNCLNAVPGDISMLGNDAAHLFLVVSLAAIGMQTNLLSLLSMGIKPYLALIFTTLLLACSLIAMIFVFDIM